MAAGETRITLTDGTAISVYNNSTAIQSPCPVLTTGIAASTSPLDFQVNRMACIDDIVTTATAGEVEVFEGSVRTNKKILLDARYAYSNSMRKRFLPRICFKPGVKYSLVVTATTS